MATVVDALVVEVLLQAEALKKGTQQVQTLFGNVTSGAGKMSAGVSKATDTAADSFRHLERNALAFLAVLTGGKALKAFVSDTTTSNVAAGQLARNLGTSVNTLTTWQKVAEAAGGSASDMSSSLGSLVSQFQTIDGRRNLGMAFGQMGVRLEDAHGRLRDFNALLPDMARAAQRLGPQLFSTLAGQAGFSQGAINMLELGPKRIEGLYKALKKYEPTERDTKASAQLLADWTKLTAQSESFGRSIMTDLSPEVHHLMMLIGGVIDKKQGVWLQDIDQYVTRFGDAIEHVDWKGVGDELKRWWDYLKSIDWQGDVQGIENFAKKIDAAVESTTGWMNAAKLLLDLWVGAKFAEVLANVQKLAVATGIGMGGLSKILAAAGVGYAAHEGLEYVDPNDQIGRWFDNNIPGAAILDNWASKVGLGRSYEEQDAASGTPAGIADRQNILQQLDRKYGFPAGTMDAIWAQESSRGQNAHDSIAGAQGDFQIMPDVAREAGVNPHNWRQAASYAALRIAKDRDKFGSLAMGVAAYNAGARRVENLWSDYSSNWLAHAPKETRDYVNHIGLRVAHHNASVAFAKDGGDTLFQSIVRKPPSASAFPGKTSDFSYVEAMQKAIGSTPSAGASGDTNNITTHINITAPNNDPKAIAKEARNAFNDIRFRARQANLGLT
ncbi:phage related protein [Acetobacter pomorum DSM 11825]|uniref:lytic transglycosylase domain-containing protein n=1 Tax=Acetobacter pomorum TaxID=65959 RepID=UPI001177DFAA|nr:lytic transglycosylase domain-containing protein [Acetobacter pomorum]GBR51216.1 phage related protein [Acetobacter pomorum DSM 11825]